ncbi:scavenger receptor class F member 1-like [Argopecten irradians]|uniref:scavenger receptor class F member 1-like n=1 Tax=Argopecten irradians TaxID=31199 RepID=UPI00372040C7
MAAWIKAFLSDKQQRVVLNGTTSSWIPVRSVVPKGCEDGNFGSYCNKTCPLDCRGKVCEQRSGTCGGCSSGKYGFTCNKTCPSCFQSNRCSQVDGTCEVTHVAVKGEECFVLKVIFPGLLAIVIAVCTLIVTRIKQKYSPSSSPSMQTASYFDNKTAMEMDQPHVYITAASVKE